MTAQSPPLPPLPAVAKPAQVLEAIAALRAGELLATDADETLWAADVGDEVMRLAAAGVPWLPPLVSFADYAAQMEHGDYAAACRLSATVLARIDPQLAHAALVPVLAAVTLRPWLALALRQAAERGVLVWIVSASPRPVVQWAAQAHGMQVAGVIGIEVADGAACEPAPVGYGKVAAWAARGLPQPALALGDSKWDAPLLAMAKCGFLLEKASLEASARA